MDENIKGFKTERGSIYTHLPDGRVQRFKTAEEKVCEPSDSIVFIPDFESLEKDYSGNKRVMEYLNKNMGSNEIEFKEFLSEAIYKGKSVGINNVHMCDGENILRNNGQINSANELYLTFLRDREKNLFLPVNKNPVIGYYPFERSNFYSSKGYRKNVHLGNKVTDIVRK